MEHATKKIIFGLFTLISFVGYHEISVSQENPEDPAQGQTQWSKGPALSYTTAWISGRFLR